MRNRDPRFFLFLAVFWLAFAIYISGVFAAQPHWNSPRIISMIAALLASGISLYRYIREKRKPIPPPAQS